MQEEQPQQLRLFCGLHGVVLICTFVSLFVGARGEGIADASVQPGEADLGSLVESTEATEACEGSTLESKKNPRPPLSHTCDASNLHTSLHAGQTDEDNGTPVGRVYIVTQATAKVEEWAKYSAELNTLYAKRHGHSFVVDTRAKTDSGHVAAHLLLSALPPDVKMDARWNKLGIILDHLTSQEESCSNCSAPSAPEWMLWLDADAVFVDHTPRLLDFLPSAPDVHFVASNGGSLAFNSGALLLRRHPWTVKFLQEWWREGLIYSHKRNLQHKEGGDVLPEYEPGLELFHAPMDEVLHSLFKQNKYGFRKHSLMLPAGALNTDPTKPVYESLEDSQPFVIHLMALPGIVRKNVFVAILGSKGSETPFTQRTMVDTVHATCAAVADEAREEFQPRLTLGDRVALARECYELAFFLPEAEAEPAMRASAAIALDSTDSNQLSQCVPCTILASSALLFTADLHARRKPGLKEAIRLCVRAHEIDPGSIDALTNLGGYLLEAGLVSEAKRALTAAVHIATHGTSQHRQMVAQLLQDRDDEFPSQVSSAQASLARAQHLLASIIANPS